MAWAYGDFPVVGLLANQANIAAADQARAVQCNNIRTAIANRDTQVGTGVVLPDVIVALDPESFEDWLLASRQCIEDFIADGVFYTEPPDEVLWTLGNLLTYVHTNWVTTAFVTVATGWAPYTAGVANPGYACYINELYYALECLCIHPVEFSKGSAVSSLLWDAGVNRPTTEEAYADGWAAAQATGWGAGTSAYAWANSTMADHGDGTYDYINPGIGKVTAAGAGVPDVAYALSELWIPFHLDNPAGPSYPTPIVGVVGGTAELTPGWEAGGYLDTLFHAMKTTGGWDNETVSCSYAFDLPYEEFGTNTETHSWYIFMYLLSAINTANGYGRSAFGGYCNGVYPV